MNLINSLSRKWCDFRCWLWRPWCLLKGCHPIMVGISGENYGMLECQRCAYLGIPGLD